MILESVTDLKADQGKPDFTVLPPEVIRMLLRELVHVWESAEEDSPMVALYGLGSDGCSPEFLAQCAQVCEHGNKKYAPDNWRADLGQPGFRVRYRKALLRHLLYYVLKGPLDADSGLPHLAHAGVNLMFLECDRQKRESTP